MALDRSQALELARTLRELREGSDFGLTQAQLAELLSSPGSKTAPATISSWESATSPKTPSADRLRAYAHFFCTPRSMEDAPHFLPDDELTIVEQDRRDTLAARLLELARPAAQRKPPSYKFSAGRVVVICPTIPEKELKDPFASESNINFTKVRQYGDLDSLIEIYGHLRASNPHLEVFHRLTHDVTRDDYSSHVVLIGGIGWNPATARFQAATDRVPIKQVAVENFKDGDIFTAPTSKGVQEFRPDVKDLGRGPELIADIGCLVRLRNPFKVSRTLTICNGVFSRGVFGAVRALTDISVRDDNERYLAERFPGGEFAMLIRVPVVTNETVSPDLQNENLRLYEWPPETTETA